MAGNFTDILVLDGADAQHLRPGAKTPRRLQDYALRIPYVSVAGLASILDFRAETDAEAKRLTLQKMYDNSLLQEIQKEIAK